MHSGAVGIMGVPRKCSRTQIITVLRHSGDFVASRGLCAEHQRCQRAPWAKGFSKTEGGPTNRCGTHADFSLLTLLVSHTCRESDFCCRNKEKKERRRDGEKEGRREGALRDVCGLCVQVHGELLVPHSAMSF